MTEYLAAPLEVKFADGEEGSFSGIASAFGNTDAHGDVVVPGAFANSLAEHKARGSRPAMFVLHGPATGADPLPVGVWDDLQETAEGLAVKGRISALDSDYGRRIRALVRDGALSGLSIGYKVAPGGAIYGKKPGDPRRTLREVKLFEVSLVPTGSNPRARVEAIKSASLIDDIEEFKSRLLTGEPPSQREFERLARDALGFTRSQAAALAARGYSGLVARESEAKGDPAAVVAAIENLSSALDGFSLPSFKVKA